MTYEIFDPKNGQPLWKTRHNWLARIFVKLFRRYDWALEGEGWPPSSDEE